MPEFDKPPQGTFMAALPNLAPLRKRVIASIKKTLAPHLHATGYVDGRNPDGSYRYTQAWVPKDTSGKFQGKSFNLRGGHSVTEFFGFTEYGVIPDYYCALAVLDFVLAPIEDLYKLDAWSKKRFCTSSC